MENEHEFSYVFAKAANNKHTFVIMNIHEHLWILRNNGKSNIFKGMNIHEFLWILQEFHDATLYNSFVFMNIPEHSGCFKYDGN
jgi:hypothetical protein